MDKLRTVESNGHDVEIKIKNWTKHQRKDIKRPTWFACDNNITRDEKFDCLNGWQFKAWIHVLCLASEKQSDTVLLSYFSAERRALIPVHEFKAAVEKLESLGVITAHVTCTSRARNVHVTPQTNKQTKQTNNNAQFLAEIGEVYSAYYPRKIGKTKGAQKLSKEIQTPDDLEAFRKAVQNYAQAVKGTEEKYIKHFSTFASEWRDWVEWQAPNLTFSETPDLAPRLIEAVKRFPAGDPKVQEYLGAESFRIFCKIGRSFIANAPDNEFGRKSIASKIKEITGKDPK